MTGLKQDVVLLTEDWHNGASAWPTQRPEAHANDLTAATSLVAGIARSNPSKSNHDPTEGLPSAGEAHCRYLAEWEDMKLRWGLSVDEAGVGGVA
ncbi:hypothetical protein ACN6LL_005200 [Streptomyces violaceoruber]